VVEYPGCGGVHLVQISRHMVKLAKNYMLNPIRICPRTGVVASYCGYAFSIVSQAFVLLDPSLGLLNWF
jgi:hypothetical protein